MVSEGQLITFQLNHQTYGIPILKVQEIIRMLPVTPVPSNTNIKGILNLRGQIIPVINLSQRFNLPERELSEKSRIIIIDHDGKKTGLIVDEVFEVINYNHSELKLLDMPSSSKDYISGFITTNNNILLLINLDVLGYNVDNTLPD